MPGFFEALSNIAGKADSLTDKVLLQARNEIIGEYRSQYPNQMN